MGPKLYAITRQYAEARGCSVFRAEEYDATKHSSVDGWRFLREYNEISAKLLGRNRWDYPLDPVWAPEPR